MAIQFLVVRQLYAMAFFGLTQADSRTICTRRQTARRRVLVKSEMIGKDISILLA